MVQVRASPVVDGGRGHQTFGHLADQLIQAALLQEGSSREDCEATLTKRPPKASIRDTHAGSKLGRGARRGVRPRSGRSTSSMGSTRMPHSMSSIVQVKDPSCSLPAS